MGPREVTRTILDLVERVSGHPVLVSEDPSLRTFASVRMARGDAPAHTIQYNPASGAAVDYLIAYQCGFILRLFTVPPAERWDFAPSAQGREIVDRLLRGADGPARKLNLPPQAVERLRDQLFDGLMLQLRSVPVGLRVDTWILREYPDLAPVQKTAALRQLQDNQATLGPDVRQIAPTEIYNASVSINAAFAAFWSGTFGDPALDLPYKAAGFQKSGLALVSFLDEIPDEPASDRSLIEAWGGALNVSSWYQWVPFGTVAAVT